MCKIRVGLTGGIASGKTVVTDFLEELGAVLVDYDVLARKVVQPGTPGLAVLAQVFGKEILLPDGSLDRDELGEFVFDDEQARGTLNSVLHPLIIAAGHEFDETAQDGSVIIHVVPLLVETGLVADFDKVIVVDVPIEMQISRLMERNDYNRMQAKKRIAAQATREARLAVADYVIDNSGTVAETLIQANQVWQQLLAVLADNCDGDTV